MPSQAVTLYAYMSGTRRFSHCARVMPRLCCLSQIGGCKTRQGCWITAVSWATTHDDRQPDSTAASAAQSQLLLASGSSDGSVTLFGQAASQLSSLSALTSQHVTMPGSQATTALMALAIIVPPDLRGVTCLHLQCMRNASGDHCLCKPNVAISTHLDAQLNIGTGRAMCRTEASGSGRI